MNDVLNFDKMLTPKIITGVYWILLAVIVLGGLFTIFQGGVVTGILGIIVGVITARIYCELMIVIFKMNESLHDIRHKINTTPQQSQQE